MPGREIGAGARILSLHSERPASPLGRTHSMAQQAERSLSSRHNHQDQGEFLRSLSSARSADIVGPRTSHPHAHKLGQEIDIVEARLQRSLSTDKT